MSHKPSVLKSAAVLLLAFAMTLAVTSCGSQKMGCPGSITKSEQPAPSHS